MVLPVIASDSEAICTANATVNDVGALWNQMRRLLRWSQSLPPRNDGYETPAHHHPVIASDSEAICTANTTVKRAGIVWKRCRLLRQLQSLLAIGSVHTFARHANTILFMEKGGWVYMMTTVDNTALYTGVTSDLRTRYHQHTTQAFSSVFTARYYCVKLVYYQFFPSIEAAIAEEKRIKGGSRKKKNQFVEAMNPDWHDLGGDM